MEGREPLESGGDADLKSTPLLRALNIQHESRLREQQEDNPVHHRARASNPLVNIFVSVLKRLPRASQVGAVSGAEPGARLATLENIPGKWPRAWGPSL